MLQNFDHPRLRDNRKRKRNQSVPARPPLGPGRSSQTSNESASWLLPFWSDRGSKPMMLNPEQCWAKAAECWDAARRARYVEAQRLYEEIGEQWMLVADQIADGQQSRAVLAAR
jgi:hypothetical protein